MNSKSYSPGKETSEHQSISEKQRASFLQRDIEAPGAVIELSDECLALIYGAGGNAQVSGFGLASVVESLLGGMTGKG